jgi:peroxiredoxin Q/BCP
MSQKKVKAARRVQRAAAPPVRSKASSSFWRSWKGGAVAAAVVALVAGSFVLPGVFSKKTTSAGAAHAMSMGAEHGEGLPVGSAVPSFSESNVETGQAISSKTLFRHKTLLFFSEGVMCQACFEQIKGLEQFDADLSKRGIELVSITPDPPSDLKQAIAAYGITTPMISDDNRDMSEAFNTLGKGMHGDTPGHAFALIDKGKVLWYRDYWLPPDRAMYVEPAKLLAAIPAT